MLGWNDLLYKYYRHRRFGYGPLTSMRLTSPILYATFWVVVGIALAEIVIRLFGVK